MIFGAARILLMFCMRLALQQESPPHPPLEQGSVEAVNTNEEAEAGTRGPSWLKWGAEFHGRLELPTALDFDQAVNDQYYLNRIRIWGEIESTPWLRFYVQGQDARAVGLSDPDAKDSAVHHLDFREAYVDFGREKSTWSFRAGRQELVFGDERLVGADNEWDALGQTFDAVRLSYQRLGVRVDSFGAFVVPLTCQGMARASTGKQLYGIYTSFEGGDRRPVFEPYALWKSDRSSGQGQGSEDDRDVFTYGMRMTGALPLGLDYNTEIALQRGHRAEESVRAWAGHWELGVRLGHSNLAPRLGVEYNFASGDGRSGDGRHGTFDDLYPAGYNQYGMSDPFAWRNLRNISGGLSWKFSKRWRLTVGARAFWLANIQDALYTRGDDYLTINPNASSDHVGDQASVMLAWEHSKTWQLYAGYARFVPGRYLTDSSFHGQWSTPFLVLNYRFE